MMTKLGAGHAADVVRLWIDAHPTRSVPIAVPELAPLVENPGIARRIGEGEPIRRSMLRRRAYRQ
jgi:hypothetical protein